MFTLDKVHVGQSKREFKRQTAAADAEEVRHAFQGTKDRVINANLYSLEISAYIKRIVNLYIHAATANIATGTVTEDWTRKKKSAAHHLEYIVEKVLAQKLRYGEQFKSELTLDLDTYQKEYLSNARREFFEKTQWLPPEGNFEKIYIPMMEICIESIYRIYCLYQIENITNADLRNRELDNETISLILTAQSVAQDRVRTLLEPLEPKNLQQAVVILRNIENEYDRLSVISAAAEEYTSQANQPTKINMTQFLTVNRAFAIELDKREKLDEDAALHNIGTVTKRGVAVAVGVVGTATTLLGQGALYLSELALDTIGGPLENDNVRLRRIKKEAGYDTDTDDDDYDEEDTALVEQKISVSSPSSAPIAVQLQSTPPPSIQTLIHWEYENETSASATQRPYSPSKSTAPASSDKDVVTEKNESQKLESIL
jgi:hypothetical protein